MGRRMLKCRISGWHALRNEGRGRGAKTARAISIIFTGAMLCAFAMPTDALAATKEKGDSSPNQVADYRIGASNDYCASPLFPCRVAPRITYPTCGCCPDDYCRKPLPGVCPPCGTTCDTYCRKPLPGVPCLDKSCMPDCYRVKPFPPCPRVCEPWYTCGPRKCAEPK